MGVPALLFQLSSTDCVFYQIPVAVAINSENVYKLLVQPRRMDWRKVHLFAKAEDVCFVCAMTKFA